MEKNSESVLHVDRLRYAYPGSAAALDEISFRLAPGERVGVVGANGAGKTTLFLTLCGVLKPPPGRVSVFGLDPALADQRRLLPSRVGIVFQNSDDQLFNATVFDDVAFGPLNLRLDEEEVRTRVAEALRRVGLEGADERVVFHLSGGAKRRAALAGVLAMRPELLLLDEPSMFLDPPGRRGLITLIRELPGSMLIASHDMDLILDTCPRVLLLSGGRLVGDGPTDEILGNRALMHSHGLEVPNRLLNSALPIQSDPGTDSGSRIFGSSVHFERKFTYNATGDVMALDELRRRCGQEWPSIDKAEHETRTRLLEIRALVRREGFAAAPAFDSEDLSMVVFGSFARGEWTRGSDLDWTLLVDGQADPEHTNTAGQLYNELKNAEFHEPGPSGLFGKLAFSHNLIHQIGGNDDTNRNTTQRMLMLLESRPVNRADAYDRTLKGILRRYLKDDPSQEGPKVPRFLLNDLNRYWRTVCVDFANKYRDRLGDGWAVRKLKLRMSRKLIFASGLLTCLGCDARLMREYEPELARDLTPDRMVEYLNGAVRRAPLHVLAEGTLRYGTDETAQALFTAYDRFLAALDDPDIRHYLRDLLPADGEADGRYQELLSNSRDFHRALSCLFFRDHAVLADLTRDYGIF